MQFEEFDRDRDLVSTLRCQARICLVDCLPPDMCLYLVDFAPRVEAAAIQTTLAQRSDGNAQQNNRQDVLCLPPPQTSLLKSTSKGSYSDI